MYRDNISGEYPLYKHEVQARRPNISLPEIEWSDEVLELINVSYVNPTIPPSIDIDKERLYEDDPYMEIDGQYYQRWKVVEC